MKNIDFSSVVVFGGTTEGRLIAEELYNKGLLSVVCVATEYGETFLSNQDKVRVGRLDVKEMTELLSSVNPTLVVDATHPYATLVTSNIIEACKNTGYKYIRVSRDSESFDEAGIYEFSELSGMIEWLNQEEGNIFSTLGVKEISALTAISDYKKRVFVRVLPVKSSMEECASAGFDEEHIIAAMGPFSYEQNIKMMNETSAKILLTKESGKAGGFLEKIRAARDCDLKIAILKRPAENKTVALADVEELLSAIKKMR